ncbi:MAG: LrgB family protein [Campylobacterales bacterium]|nr:LrgB family protein [Campylobacterales bacterium]
MLNGMALLFFCQLCGEVLGGIPAMMAAFVVFTGITGAVIGLRVLKAAASRMRVRSGRRWG